MSADAQQADDGDVEQRQLLQHIAARDGGSEAAMARLYRMLHSRVFAFIRRRWSGADDHQVQAVAVEVLYEVWRSASRFSGGSRVSTWVLGIARHRALDAIRYDRRHPPADEDDTLGHDVADDDADLLMQLAQRQRAEWLAWCMDRLPPDQRESLHLLLVEAMSVDDIAAVQGCPPGTVKSRVFGAKRKLGQCLQRWLQADMDPGPLTTDGRGA